jgi:hypothetical protein
MVVCLANTVEDNSRPRLKERTDRVKIFFIAILPVYRSSGSPHITRGKGDQTLI